jgi:GAF domain-containing protein
VADLGPGPGPLPRDFTRRARASGYAAVFAVPVRHRDEVLGALVLYRAAPGLLPGRSAAVARSLADAAAIGVLQRRTRRRHQRLAAQLQTALDSRIPVEQVKGVLAERWHISVDDAFALLRAHARSHQIRVADLAASILSGTTTLPAPSIPTS